MKRFFTLTIASVTAFVFGSALPALAQGGALGRLKNVGGAAGFNQDQSLAVTVGQIIRGMLALLGVVFMAYIIYGGFLWLMARGNEDQIEKAKSIIRGSIIGLAIILSAYAITAFVISRLTAATGYKG